MVILDNDFRNPDLDRFLEKVERYEPDVAILGDAETRSEAEQYQDAANELRETYEDVEPVIVPKCRGALNLIDSATVVGWPNGYANVNPLDYSEVSEWRGRPVWILGGSPPSQHDVIQLLTQPTLTGDPPADIVGLDGNGVHKAALYGEYWTPNGYRRADHLTIRETVNRSLQEIKRYWQDLEVWPDTTPIEEYGPAVLEPDDPLYVVNAGDITTREELEASIVEEYDGGQCWAYRTETEKAFIEYREGLL